MSKVTILLILLINHVHRITNERHKKTQSDETHYFVPLHIQPYQFCANRMMTQLDYLYKRANDKNKLPPGIITQSNIKIKLNTISKAIEFVLKYDDGSSNVKM